MIFCLQHNIDYVDKNSEKRCHMKEFEAFLAKAIEQKTTLVQSIFCLSVMITEQLLTMFDI